jgi:L-amino acid N-acyltransferase YncA
MLRDGRKVVIRPLARGDCAALAAFAADLSRGGIQYIPDDFQNPAALARLAPVVRHARQLVALAGDAIVGYAAVHRLSGESRRVGEVELVVAAGWRNGDLGRALAAALLGAAHELQVAELVVELPEEQVADRMNFERLGFSIEGVLEGQIRDQYGQRANLLVMANQLD